MRDSHVALKKAQQFLEAAQSELANERWDAAGLSAIHSGICAADAVLIRVAGLRSASQDHEHVSTMLLRSAPSFKGNPRTQLLSLLKMKNTVAYEQRLITQQEAVGLVTAATRLLSWAADGSRG